MNTSFDLLFEIAWRFASLSLLAIGGINALLARCLTTTSLQAFVPRCGKTRDGGYLPCEKRGLSESVLQHADSTYFSPGIYPEPLQI